MPNPPELDTSTALTVLAASTMDWKSIALLAGLLIALTAMALLAEWQARSAIAALARTAPLALITTREDISQWQAVLLLSGADADRNRRGPRT